MLREQRVGSTPTSPTPVRSRRADAAGPSGVSPPILPGDADHDDARPQVHHRARDRAAPGAPGQGDPARRAAPLAPDARPRLPPGQGAAAGPRAGARARRRPRRRRRAPRPGRLSRGAGREGDPAADQRRRRGRAGGGGQAAGLQGDRPGPPGGQARRLQGLQLRAGDRDHRRRPGRPGHRGAARPERDADRGRGPRREGRRLRGHRVRRDPRRHAVRGRHLGADAADPRAGAPDPGLRGAPGRPRGRRLDRVRHHVPRRLRRARAGRARPSTSRSTSRSSARRSCPSSTTTSSTRWATSPTSTP